MSARRSAEARERVLKLRGAQGDISLAILALRREPLSDEYLSRAADYLQRAREQVLELMSAQAAEAAE